MTDTSAAAFRLAFGRRLRAARMVLGLTEQEAATAAQVTLKTWLRYEAGAPMKSIRAMIRLAEKYPACFNWTWIHGGEGEPANRVLH
jgi:DNA-binding XRE family transcriptional regulator